MMDFNERNVDLQNVLNLIMKKYEIMQKVPISFPCSKMESVEQKNENCQFQFFCQDVWWFS